MHWKTLMAPALIAVALTLGAVSAAAAAGVSSPIAAAGPAEESSGAHITDPAVACATPSAHPALPALCALRKAGTLPAHAQHAIGGIIVRLAHGSHERPPAGDPAVACATPGAHPALPALCGVWKAGTLPEHAQHVIDGAGAPRERGARASGAARAAHRYARGVPEVPG